jgi:hypothetical protein
MIIAKYLISNISKGCRNKTWGSKDKYKKKRKRKSEKIKTKRKKTNNLERLSVRTRTKIKHQIKLFISSWKTLSYLLNWHLSSSA